MDDFKGINAATISLVEQPYRKFPTELFAKGSPISTIDLSNNLMTEIPENSETRKGNYKNTYLLTVIDLRFNKLTKAVGRLPRNHAALSEEPRPQLQLFLSVPDRNR